MEIKKKIDYCHFSLDKFYRHTRGFTINEIGIYTTAYVEYMETGKCTGNAQALIEQYANRNIIDDFEFALQKAVMATTKAQNAAKERWHKQNILEHSTSNAQALHKQEPSIVQAYANYNSNYNSNFNSNKNIKDKKNIYGKYNHVLLTQDEFNKLQDKFGIEQAGNWIHTLDEGIELKGYKYKSHYLAILKWSKNEHKRYSDKGDGLTMAEKLKIAEEM